MARLNDSFPEEIARLKNEIAALKESFNRERAKRCQCEFDGGEYFPCKYHGKKDEEIAALQAELESHAWEISPAMAQAKIDELNVEIAALKEAIDEI